MSDLSSRNIDVLQELDGSSEEIGNKLGIAPTTVKDHIAKLRDAGYKIEYDRGQQEFVLKNEPQTEPNDVGPEPDRQSSQSDIPTFDTGGEPEEQPTTDDLPRGFVNALKQGGLTYADIEEEYGYSPSQSKRLFQEMREEGFAIDFKVVDNNGTRLWHLSEERDKRYAVGDGDGNYEFAIISDTHLGSKAEHLDELHDFYDRVQERGIEIVFHAGDISDGWNVHRGQINEVKGAASGWDRLQDYVVENYPKREGVDTLFISGNHDHKLQRRTGIYFAEQVANQREDLHWCGDSQATFVFDESNDIDLELIHPSGGKPYTVGYRLQTLYRERPVNQRPSIAAVGHIHGSMYAETEGVKGLYAGCWKGLTTWGKRKGHVSNIGGWIITMEIRDGEIRQFVPEWVGYSSNDESNNFDMEEISEMVS